MLHTLYHWLAWNWGGDGWGGPNSTGYLINSGPGQYVAVTGAAVVFVWSHLCTEPGCWRPARRKDGKGHLVCFKHWRNGLPKSAWEAIPLVREAYERMVAEREERDVGDGVLPGV